MSNNLDKVKNIYQAFSVGDIPTVLATLAPDVHWTEAAGGPYGGISEGPDAVLANVFMKLGTEWDGFSAVPSEFVADGSTIVALGTYTGTYKETGKGFEASFAHVWKFRDGKVFSFEQHTDTFLHRAPMQA